MQFQELGNNLAQYELGAGSGNATRRSVWRAVLLFAAVLQAVFLLWLFGQGRDEACRRVHCGADTVSYVTPAQSVLNGAGLPPDMFRTVGYPLFLTIPFWLGGEQYGYHLTVVIQSILNLLATLLFGKLLAALLPQISMPVSVIAVAIFWYVGFGLALNVLTDFLFGFLLLVFFYAFWLQRGPLWLAISAGALLAAGLTRPTLGPFLLLLPLLRVLVQRRFSRLPRASVVVYAAAIVVSSGANFALEHARAERRSGSFKAHSMRLALFDKGIATESEVVQRVAELAGRPIDQLTRREQDAFSWRVFVEYVSSKPACFMRGVALNMVKYILSPVEAVVMKVVGSADAETYGRSFTRKLVFVLGLPIWTLALWPGMSRRPETRDLYLFALVVGLYFIGMSSAACGGVGERYRFPAVPMLLLCFAFNLDRLVGWVNSRLVLLQRKGAV